MTLEESFEFRFLRVLHWKVVMQREMGLILNLQSSPLFFPLLAPHMHRDGLLYTCVKPKLTCPNSIPRLPHHPQDSRTFRLGAPKSGISGGWAHLII